MSIKLEINFHNLYNYLSDVASKFNIWYLLLISFALHLFSIAFPSDGGKIFDEVYYVSAAENTLKGIAANAEQTPLAKLMVALSIKLLGDNWFAWRIPIVICGIISLYAFYLIAKRFMNERYALFATAMLSFDVMFFIHGSIFVLDMPSICFGLIGIYLFLTKKYGWAAASFGVSFLMYAVGLLFAATVLIYHILTHLKLEEIESKVNVNKLLTFLVVIILIGGGGLWAYDAVYKPSSGAVIYTSTHVNIFVNNGTAISTQTLISNITSAKLITNPVENILFSWNYFSSLSVKLTTPASEFRPPWDWILPIGNSLNPPHYLTVAVTTGGITRTTIDWVSQITPFIEYFLLPIVAIALFNIVIKKDDNKTGLFLLSWITATYIPFLLLGIIAYPHWTNFNYYMLPTIPACALGIPYVWDTIIKNGKTRWMIMPIQLALTVIFFLYLFPVKI